MNANSLQGRVAIVTGAGRGIGLEIARRLLADGAVVMISDLEAASLKAATEALGVEPGRVAVYQGDLSQAEIALALVARTVEKFGRVDILVNNAGGGVIRPFLDHTPETLKATIDRNLWTTLWCCQAVLPVMIAAGRGRIINIGADSVRNGLRDHAAYNAAKGGVHGLTTGLAREFARQGVTVNTIAPPATNTEALVEYRERSPEGYQEVIGVIPLGRPAEMSEIAAMVAFIAGDEAAFVTGQVISVNGGSTML